MPCAVFVDDNRPGFIPGIDDFGEASEAFSAGRSVTAQTGCGKWSNVHVVSGPAEGEPIPKIFSVDGNS
jgi:hypothetical protein